MLKITDPNYYLPLVHATEGVMTLSSGTTQPMLIRGICTTTTEKGDYVVKYKSSPRMSIQSLCRELIAAFIANQLDVKVAEPAIISVSPEFVETLIGKDGYKAASNSVGLNFGCLYAEGLIPFVKGKELSEAQYNEAVKIFALDVFISNVDRNEQKPNMLTDGENIMIFDHELAFGFVMDIIKNKTPWIISEADKNWIKKHYFYPILRDNEHNFDSFVENFELINDTFWSRVDALVPKEWRCDLISEIKSNLTQLIDNRTTFLNELNRVLS